MEQRPWQLGQHHKQHPANSTQKQHLACEQHPAVAAFFVNQTVFLVNQDFFFRKSKRILRKPSNSETITVFFGNEVLRKPKPVLPKPKGLFRKPSSETENRFSDTKKYSSETNVFGNKNGFLQKLKRILRMPPGQEYANCFPFFWK
jgi:hypothetical protein